ncbi:hypothetical protein L1049_018114 [Liquidambar formosana]|uniref:Uncharacterized protein n=1 Tax=Liquidambar formosana TaxID=63359 RepID=A0AAP0NKP2_LIQFO
MEKSEWTAASNYNRLSNIATKDKADKVQLPRAISVNLVHFTLLLCKSVRKFAFGEFHVN